MLHGACVGTVIVWNTNLDSSTDNTLASDHTTFKFSGTSSESISPMVSPVTTPKKINPAAPRVPMSPRSVPQSPRSPRSGTGETWKHVEASNRLSNLYCLTAVKVIRAKVVPDQSQTQPIHGHSSLVSALTISADCHSLYSGDLQGNVVQWAVPIHPHPHVASDGEPVGEEKNRDEQCQCKNRRKNEWQATVTLCALCEIEGKPAAYICDHCRLRHYRIHSSDPDAHDPSMTNLIASSNNIQFASSSNIILNPRVNDTFSGFHDGDGDDEDEYGEIPLSEW